MNKYYVYKHINTNGEVFYIGSNHRAGNPLRAYNFIQRSKLWKENSKPGFTVEIVKYFSDREECVKYEHKLIHYYHDIGQCKACKEDRRGKNNGMHGYKWKNGTHPMFGSEGGFKNKSHSKEIKLQIRESNPNRHIIYQFDLNNNLIREYLSLRQVEEITGYNRKTISKRCIDEKSYKGFYWRKNNNES